MENIEEIIAVVNENERLAMSNLSDPVEEMTELDYMLENIDGEAIDGEEAIANDAARTYKLAELKDLCKAINIPSTGNKTVLFQRIRDSGNEFTQRIDDESFVYKKKKGEEVDSFLPRWVILNPEPAPTVEGFDMLRGAEEGFFGPTNQDLGCTFLFSFLFLCDRNLEQDSCSY